MKKIKNHIAIVLALGILLGAVAGGAFSCKSVAASNTKDYGVFIGVDFSDKTKAEKEAYIKKMGKYKEVVIDAQAMSAKDIKAIKKKGTQKVYSYINVGSIENTRSYYKKYKKYTLGDYENWPEEKWMDVSQKAWQKFIVGTIAEKLHKKGIDGYFVDNCDVYFQYKKNKIYKGLNTIVKGLRKKESVVIINGGDSYVRKALKQYGKNAPFTAVNQESVYTRIVDYDHNGFKAQTKDETKYFVEYLKECKKKGVKVYILEYTKDKKLKNKAYDKAKKYGWTAYVSKKLNLT